jgi:hypothetical protein
MEILKNLSTLGNADGNSRKEFGASASFPHFSLDLFPALKV